MNLCNLLIFVEEIVPDFSIENSYLEKNIITAGIDEAGRGPLAGPVVASSVILPEDVSDLESLDDSKKLTHNRREALFDLIESAAISVGIGIIYQDEIDKINILQATLKAMHLAAGSLSITPGMLLIDGNYFRSDIFPYKTLIKGDSKSYSIAAASIIAKVTRDRIMEEYAEKYPEYGFDRHKGYATKSHFEMIEKNGICPIHRKSFLKKFFERQECMFPDNI